MVTGATAACSGGDGADDTLAPLPRVSPPAAPTTATTPPAAPTAAPSTASPTTPLTVEPGEIVLRPDGLHAVSFGDPPDDVIATMSSVLRAEPSFDSGWTDPASIGGCPGAAARAVSWGSLTLYFSDSSDVARGRRHFFTYYYGEADRFDAPPVGLLTLESLTVGATVAELRRTYDDVATFPAGADYPATFITSSGLFGVVTGEAADDRVAVIAGGEGCGR
jgi:hypothetical protein